MQFGQVKAHSNGHSCNIVPSLYLQVAFHLIGFLSLLFHFSTLYLGYFSFQVALKYLKFATAFGLFEYFLKSLETVLIELHLKDLMSVNIYLNQYL